MDPMLYFQFELPLKVVSYKDFYGWTMDEIVKIIGQKIIAHYVVIVLTYTCFYALAIHVLCQSCYFEII